MLRRKLELAASLSVITSLAALPAMAAEPRTILEAASKRDVQPLMQGWRFHFGDPVGDATQAQFDDSTWEAVALPHSWNRIGSYNTVRGSESNNRQGFGWYRLEIKAPPIPPGYRQYLDFAAVSKIGDIWVNGQHVGTHRGAFGRFRIDVSAIWKPGQDNSVVVRADNSKVEPGSATSEVIPLSGDFFVHGGIYREVALLQLPAASIDPLDHGGPGVYARATAISDDRALVEVRTRLRNVAEPRTLRLVTSVTDAAGKTVARTEQPVQLAQGASETVAHLSIARPHRWDGRHDPYLYTVTAKLMDGTRAIDQVDQPLGLRTYRFDANNGFFLNGRHLKLHGVSRHQDALGSGWGLTTKQHDIDMALIQELGANTVRQAHYQHADRWSDLADRAGMVVWAELPYVTSPSLKSDKGSDALWANAEEQLREQIRQNYNHPSIMMWSVGNEVDSAKGFGQKGAPPKPLALLQRLNAVAHQEDPDRPTTMADCCEGLGMIQTAGEKVVGTTDLVGYNRYYGWYYPKPLEMATQLGATLDKLHADHPTLPLSLSEYGGGGAVSQHSDDVRAGYVNFVGRPHPEEYEAWLHEQSWPVIAARDHVFASWVWAMFDFGSDLRDEGDSVDLNDKGLITADRKVRKDAFWFYHSAWSETPTLHLAGKHYVDRAYPLMDVKAYSNAPSATLTFNGRKLGSAPCVNFVCEWKRVALKSGANKAVVASQVGGRTLRDEATWNGPDATAGIRIDVGNLGGRQLAGQRFGSDAFVSGGSAMVLNLVGFGGRSLAPLRKVETTMPELFEYWREGDAFAYDIPVPAGRWTIKLHMFEPRPGGTDKQALTIMANGATALDGFNIARSAGGPLREVIRSFPVTVGKEGLQLDFRSTGGKASLAAIEIVR